VYGFLWIPMDSYGSLCITKSVVRGGGPRFSDILQSQGLSFSFILSHSLSFSFILFHSLSFSLILSYSLSFSLILFHSLSFSLSFSLILSFRHSDTQTLRHSRIRMDQCGMVTVVRISVSVLFSFLHITQPQRSRLHGAFRSIELQPSGC
jgi:hypothetical protein